MKIQHIYPGVLIAALVALASNFLGEHYGAPVMLLALLIGMTLNFLMDGDRVAEGINFSAKRLLRIGVALLGLRISFGEISKLGFETVAVVGGLIALTVLSGFIGARFLSKGWRFALLTGGSVAICGASAALAISSVLPKNDLLERNTLFTVIAVTLLSTVAMIVYPILFAYFNFTPDQIGFLLGATIHDVAQVVGAGYSVSQEVGDQATVIKLLRVSFLPIVVAIILISTRKQNEGGQVPIPWFVVAFIALVLINSLITLPKPITDIGSTISRAFLVTAIAALGVKTSLKMMFDVGGKHLIMVVFETLVLLCGAIAWIVYL